MKDEEKSKDEMIHNEDAIIRNNDDCIIDKDLQIDKRQFFKKLARLGGIALFNFTILGSISSLNLFGAEIDEPCIPNRPITDGCSDGKDFTKDGNDYCKIEGALEEGDYCTNKQEPTDGQDHCHETGTGDECKATSMPDEDICVYNNNVEGGTDDCLEKPYDKDHGDLCNDGLPVNDVCITTTEEQGDDCFADEEKKEIKDTDSCSQIPGGKDIGDSCNPENDDDKVADPCVEPTKGDDMCQNATGWNEDTCSPPGSYDYCFLGGKWVTPDTTQN